MDSHDERLLMEAKVFGDKITNVEMVSMLMSQNNISKMPTPSKESDEGKLFFQVLKSLGYIAEGLDHFYEVLRYPWGSIIPIRDLNLKGLEKYISLFEAKLEIKLMPVNVCNLNYYLVVTTNLIDNPCTHDADKLIEECVA